MEKASNAPTTPTKVMVDGVTLFLLETEKPLYISDWAAEAAVKNVNGKAGKRQADSRSKL